jgi:hypothetical protein
MARLLLQGSPYADEDWRFLPASRASTAVQKAANIFDIRCGTTNLEILYSLGALLPLEMAAHRQIIPGEVTAFVTSGHYGLTLSDIPYLAEHAGECGAEHLHENAITVLINSLDVDHDPEFEDKVMHGCREFLDALEGFYDSLKRIISVAS